MNSINSLNHKVLTFIFILLFTSCSSPKKWVYETSANDVAEIELVLRKNNKFQLHFKDLDEKPEKKYTFKGNWLNRKEMIQMLFKLDRKGLPDINALFDPSLAPTKTIRILDNKTIEFKQSLKSIYIWGLPCIKTDLDKR